MKLPNRNQILIAIGLIVVEGPDVAAVAAWMNGLGIPQLAKVVHFLGWLATALGSAALAWPAIRARLALWGLTTPPGQLAPWTPGKDVPANTATVVPPEEQITPPKGVVVKTQLPPSR